MTNIYIAYPDIPFNSVVITPSATMHSFMDEMNLVCGERYQRAEFASGTTTRNYKFDLGTAYASKQATVDHLILARADLLQAAGVTRIQLASSSDDSAYTDRIDDSSFASATLYGPRSDDYISTLTATAQWRYWRLTYTAGGSTVFPHSKAYFGARFAPVLDPDYAIDRICYGRSAWRAASGAAHLARSDQPIYRVKLDWTGLTDEEVELFALRVGALRMRALFFLYTSTFHPPLDSKRLLHVRLVDYERSSRKNNYNDLTATFEEAIG